MKGNTNSFYITHNQKSFLDVSIIQYKSTVSVGVSRSPPGISPLACNICISHTQPVSISFLNKTLPKLIINHVIRKTFTVNLIHHRMTVFHLFLASLNQWMFCKITCLGCIHTGYQADKAFICYNYMLPPESIQFCTHQVKPYPLDVCSHTLPPSGI